MRVLESNLLLQGTDDNSEPISLNNISVSVECNQALCLNTSHGLNHPSVNCMRIRHIYKHTERLIS